MDLQYKWMGLENTFLNTHYFYSLVIRCEQYLCLSEGNILECFLLKGPNEMILEDALLWIKH